MSTQYPGGPLQIEDFEALWESVVDEDYAQAFQAAGEGYGYEAFTQGFAQLTRVSQAIDVSTQALYILPWSGQTNPPASGANKATVTLTFSRTGRLQEPLVLTAGSVFYDEQENDWAPNAGVVVQTGRRYTLLQNLVFQPGQQGPLQATAQAERPGYGYNNPQPGSINVVDQVGSGYNNGPPTGASLLVNAPAASPSAIANVQLVVSDNPDVVVPGHLGQYVLLAAGCTAAGSSFRMVGYLGPNPAANPPTGGTVALEWDACVVDTSGGSVGANGPFAPGEIVSGPNGYLLFLGSEVTGAGHLCATFVFRSGNVAPGDLLTGSQSGATMTATLFLANPAVTASTAGAVSWRVLDWVKDWGLTVTNALQPSGGASAILDALGRERALPRISGEADVSYRPRVATIADVVTPNAVLRALNRSLTQGLGVPWYFREAGSSSLPGFFWGDGRGNGDFFDYDAVIPNSTSASFQSGEKVQQTVNGVNATGRALIGSAPALVLGSGAAFGSITAGMTAVLGYDNQPNFTVTFLATDTTAAACAARINASIIPGPTFPFCTVVGGQLELNGIVNGLAGSVRVVSGSALTDLGLPVTNTPGTVFLKAIANVSLNTPFVGNVAVVGVRSGASTTPSAFAGGVSAANQWKVWFDYLDFRAFFLVEVGRSDEEDFGFFWGVGNSPGSGGLLDFFDAGPIAGGFYDGVPVATDAGQLAAYHAVDSIRAGGVGIQFVPMRTPA